MSEGNKMNNKRKNYYVKAFQIKFVVRLLLKKKRNSIFAVRIQKLKNI